MPSISNLSAVEARVNCARLFSINKLSQLPTKIACRSVLIAVDVSTIDSVLPAIVMVRVESLFGSFSLL